MSVTSTYCPRCMRSLQIPADFDNVICAGCGTPYWIRRHGELLNLSEMWPDAEDSRRGQNAVALAESRLAEIDELVEASQEEIEALRSREQSGPLRSGCAFFGLFLTVLLMIAVFMLVARSYVGSWLFYLSVVLVIFLGLVRIRRKLLSPEQLEEMREDRLEIEGGVSELLAERERILTLKANLVSEDPPTEA
jgi:hypothetical protein